MYMEMIQFILSSGCSISIAKGTQMLVLHEKAK